jgi:hypothetical protein
MLGRQEEECKEVLVQFDLFYSHRGFSPVCQGWHRTPETV